MAVQWQKVRIPFAGGLDTKSDPKQLNIGGMTEIVNGELEGINRINKRRGFKIINQSLPLTELHSAGGSVYGVGYATSGTDGGVYVIKEGLINSNRIVSNTPPIRVERNEITSVSGGRYWHSAREEDDNGTVYAVMIDNRIQVYRGGGQPVLVADLEIEAVSTSFHGVGIWSSTGAGDSDASFVVVYRNGSNIKFRKLSVSSLSLAAAVTVASDAPSALADSIVYLESDNNNSALADKERMLVYVNTSDEAIPVLISDTAVLQTYDALATEFSVTTPEAVSCVWDGSSGFVAYAYTASGSVYVATAATAGLPGLSSSLWTQPSADIVIGSNADEVQLAAIKGLPDGSGLSTAAHFLSTGTEGRVWKIGQAAFGANHAAALFIESPLLGSSLGGVAGTVTIRNRIAAVPVVRSGRVYVPILEVVSRSGDSLETRRLLLVEDEIDLISYGRETTNARIVSDPIPHYRPRDFDVSIPGDKTPKPISTRTRRLVLDAFTLSPDFDLSAENETGNQILWHVPYFESLGSNGTGGTLRVSEFVHRFGATNGSVDVDGLLLLGDGAMTAVDGQTARPSNPIAAVADLEPSATPSGSENWGFAAFYQYTDALGRIHRGPVRTWSSANGANVDITAVGLWSYLTKANAGVLASQYQVDLYRTEDNGSIYYYLASSLSEDQGASVSGAKFFEDPASIPNASGYLDTDVADAKLVQNAAIYTTAQLEAFPPPPASATIFRYGNRVLVATDDGDVWSSKPIVPGLAPEFHPTLVTKLPVSGQIKLGFEMDGSAFLLTEDSVFRLTGSGFAANGSGGGFQVLQLNSPIGPKYRNVMGIIPAGVLFVSDRGVEVMTRDLQVAYIGAAVERYTDNSYPVGITVAPERSQARVYLADGNVLVYDYLVNQWTTWDLQTNTGSISGAPALPAIRGAVRGDGRDYLLRTRGFGGAQIGGSDDYSTSLLCDVWIEDITSYQDFTRDYSLSVKTGWISPSGLQGFMRARRFSILAEELGDHDLTVNVYYDYDDTVAQTVTFDVSAGIPSGDDRYQFRARLDRQKCSAIQFEIVSSGASNAELSLSDLTLEFAPISGISRLREQQTR